MSLNNSLLFHSRCCCNFNKILIYKLLSLFMLIYTHTTINTNKFIHSTHLFYFYFRYKYSLKKVFIYLLCKRSKELVPCRNLSVSILVTIYAPCILFTSKELYSSQFFIQKAHMLVTLIFDFLLNTVIIRHEIF